MEWFQSTVILCTEKNHVISILQLNKIIIIKKIKLIIDECEIEQFSSTNFLGVYSGQCLTWTNHIRRNAISGKIVKIIGIGY